MTDNEHDLTSLRRHWMGILAKAPRAELEQAWTKAGHEPAYELLRRPETGLAMVRGRIGGSGRRFNLGEMTMTRCVVRLDDGVMGFGFTAGRDGRKAELIALFDALLQNPAHRAGLMDAAVAPMQQAQQKRREAARARTAPTKVDFFTLVRGED